MKYRHILLVCLFIAILFPASSSAQYPFGKNKIQYAPRNWKVIETAHMEIFYYPEELMIAEFIAGLAEDVYDEYSIYFGLKFERKIPVILYGTHHDFKETNVIPYLISEAIGGFTEFIKGRVALPFVGSYGKLKAVFRHELTHVFMLEKIRVVMKNHRRYNYRHPPLWFTEGLAEFMANGGLDSNARMFIRDGVTGGLLIPLHELWRIQGTFMMYKEGESALHYIANRFGHDAIRLILENWWKSERFDLVLKHSIGLDVRELSGDWEEFLRRRYFPSIMYRRRIDEIAERISPGERSLEMHPVCLQGDNDEITVFGVGYGLGSIDLVKLKKNRKGFWDRKTFIRGESTTRFESIPLLRSRVSLKGDTLIFIAKTGKRDAIYLYDLRRKKVLERVVFQGARILNSPDLSHDGRYLVFSAISDHGKADLYIHDLDDCSFRRLTDDVYEDIHPDWHPSEHRLIFSSDRCINGLDRRYALYVIDIRTGEIEPLTDGRHQDIDPRWMPDGSGIIFSSDRDGVFDIYILSGGRLTRQTNVLGGAFGPWPCSDGNGFLVSAYRNGTYGIYRVPVKQETPSIQMESILAAHSSWQPGLPDSAPDYEKRDYRLRFGLDIIGAAFAVDPDFGQMGNSAQIFLTDMLGNHQLYFLFGYASNEFDDFWTNLNVAVTYANRSRRLNYTLGAFHLSSYLGSTLDILRFERRYGMLGGISYPFSKFTRIDLTTVVKAMERDDDITFLGLEEGSTWLISNFISLTTDNITWYIGGPLLGHRLNIALGKSFDLKGSRYESTTLHFDLRNYVNLTRRVTFAQRFVNRTAWGSDLQLFYLGGSWDLRGYRFRQFAGKRIVLINSELRFPLIDRLQVRLPFGNIEFPLFRGSLFLDAGKVSGFIFDTGWLGSIGAGVEMNMGYLPVIRVNFSRLTDFHKLEKKVNVDFFLGFNF